jgi:hypothetical protein
MVKAAFAGRGKAQFPKLKTRRREDAIHDDGQTR